MSPAAEFTRATLLVVRALATLVAMVAWVVLAVLAVLEADMLFEWYDALPLWGRTAIICLLVSQLLCAWISPGVLELERQIEQLRGRIAKAKAKRTP